jgi:phosphatidylserine decarboxylase
MGSLTAYEIRQFGEVLYIEVGATAVGSIQQTFTPEKMVLKGEEKGYFAFGGSTVLLLFEKDRIQFDKDLLED